MSKKILKRSLALGALMAFVITGNAWAEENYSYGIESEKKDCLALGAVANNSSEYNNFKSGYAYDNISIAVKQGGEDYGVSMYNDKEYVLKATKSITISSYDSGISAQNISYAVNSRLDVSAPVIAIQDVSQDNRSGIHLDAIGSKVYVKDFNSFSINTNGKNSYGIRVNQDGALVHAIANPEISNSTISINSGSSGVVTTADGGIELTADYINITSDGGNNNDSYKGQAVASKKGRIDILATKKIIITNTNKGNDTEYIGHAVHSENGTINIGTAKDDSGKDSKGKADVIINGDVKAKNTGVINLNLETAASSLNGLILDSNLSKDKDYGTSLLLSSGAKWNNSGVSSVTALTLDGGIVKQTDSNGTVNVGTLSGKGTFEVADGASGQMIIKTKDDESELRVSTTNKNISLADLTDVAVMSTSTNDKLVVAADFVEKTGGSVYEKESAALNTDGSLGKVDKVVDAGNISANNMAAVGLMSWRAEMNDMNKRMGELRNANGEHGVWVRMVRGESEYNSVKNQYNQYQLGYDEKLSVDKRWTVGAAISYTDAENNFAQGNGESTNKALSIYGSKLNADGTFVDLIAKYARLENEFDIVSGMGDAEYDVNGYSFSAEFGKRIQQGNGLWIEPQVELTYGKVGNADYVTAKGVKVAQDSMESLVGRVGFSLGKDIKDGNVYARASYLYDFEGETQATLNNDAVLKQDLGGGWWEVGVGANINLSKATYVYADVEKTFGGEVDTNWQWNLGVRYSF
ncbi:MAG: autotransporter outer membrane beta-barrel domain-containing protein [Phascolarctobacterium sp.]|nr:autotransporter outer membrane beta-barrel domain-containing protein [Phascolarctobacterium sp.]